MAKSYDVTDDMIAKLHEGDIFKSFPALCTALNVFDKKGKPLAGDSKPAFLGELERFVMLEKVGKSGRGFKVVRIYSEDEILPPRPECGNRKYVDLIRKILALHFNNVCEQMNCDGAVILWEKVDIWQTLGIVNSNYRWWGKVHGTEQDAAIAEAFRKLAGGVKLKK